MQLFFCEFFHHRVGFSLVLIFVILEFFLLICFLVVASAFPALVDTGPRFVNLQ